MGEVQFILLEIGNNIINIVSDPIFIILAILIIYMYKRTVKDSKDVIYKNEVDRTAIKDIFRGIIIGSTVSLILTSFGISMPINKGMLILIPLTMILVFINPKWGCFSYVIPISYIILQIGKLVGVRLTFFDLEYDKMIILIGVLHIIEGILVGIYGHENANKIPLYKNNRLWSGYILRKYWPVPLLIFQHKGGLVMIPIYAVLGYGDVTWGKNPKVKTRIMGTILLLYGITICFLGYLTLKNTVPIEMIILVMPILHEMMFLINWKEAKLINN